MRIANCPVCGHSPEDGSQPGDELVCPQCNFQFVAQKLRAQSSIAKQRSRTDPVIEKIQRIGRSAKAWFYENRFFWLLAIPCSIFMLTIYSGPLLGIPHYVGLALFVFFTVQLIWRDHSWRYAKLAGLAAVTMAIVTWSFFDIHEQRFRDGDTLHINSYYRFSTQPYYSYYIDPDFSFEGPRSPSGKKHGLWTMLSDNRFSETWYWYGEEITEGDWHLRNK